MQALWHKWIQEDNVSSCLLRESSTPVPNVSFIIYTSCTRKKALLSIIYLFFADSRITGVTLRGEETDVQINCLNHLRAAFPGTPARDSVRRCQGVELLPLLHLLRRLTKRHRHRHRVHLKQDRAAYFSGFSSAGHLPINTLHFRRSPTDTAQSPRARKIAPQSRAIISLIREQLLDHPTLTLAGEAYAISRYATPNGVRLLGSEINRHEDLRFYIFVCAKYPPLSRCVFRIRPGRCTLITALIKRIYVLVD